MIFEEAELIVTQELRRYGLSREAFTSGLRTRTIAHCRRTLINRLRLETPLSWREIELTLGLHKGSARFAKPK